MKITEWWWALVWAACMWAGSALTSEQGFKTPVGFGMFVGCAWGALLMRWNIKRSNAKVTGSPALSASPSGLPGYATEVEK